MILAGIDEAGYGPTLGPLVVSVSYFRVPETGPASDCGSAGSPDLWKLLQAAVCRKPDGLRAPVDDSKKLFHQEKGLRDLEEGALPFLCVRSGVVPRTLRSLLRTVANRGEEDAGSAAPDSYLDAYPWYRGRDVDLPLDTFANVVHRRARSLAGALAECGVEFLGMAACPVEVIEFNRGLLETENKALVSFRAVTGFIHALWKAYPDEAVDVLVDRQGGRMRYARHLYDRVSPRSIRIEEETEEISAYLLRRPSQGARSTFRVTFATGCEERCLAVALASMVSKYVREAHMALFNRYWREHQADLKPTAGYSTDARRFLADILPLRARLGIDDSVLVRRR